MTYPAKAIANKFLEIAKAKGLQLTPMKLQKLVYFAHGWYLSLTNGQPLINERIEAWRYGPVVPSLYHEFKCYGNNAIESFATEFDIDSFEIVEPQLPQEDKNVIALIDKVWEVYGKYSPIQLSNMTHKPDTPWAKTGGIGVPYNTDINDEVIKNYFDNIRGQ